VDTKVNESTGRYKVNIPDLFDYKTLLYIGAHVRKSFPFGMRMIPAFRKTGYSIDILEAFGPNISRNHRSHVP